jgi:aromatic ring hydroxylase
MATIPRLKKARHWKAFVSEKDTAKATEIIIKQTALRYVRLKFSSEDLKKTTQEQLDKWIKGTEKYFEVSRPRIEKYLENCAYSTCDLLVSVFCSLTMGHSRLLSSWHGKDVG